MTNEPSDLATQVIALELASRSRADEVGMKAARLGELLAAGYRVPSGVVVAPGALASPGAAAAEVRRRLGDGPFAVRSSAISEDLPGASFAGLYESLLDVSGSALASALETVAKSAGGTRVAAYRDSDADSRIAVLVQTMVPAEAAGVALTADPLTGDRGSVVVTAVAGLGEQLVSGAVDGETWHVVGEDARCVTGNHTAIDAATARTVAALARRIESEERGPQDVEWAVSGGDVFVLQARPMTAVPAEVEWTTDVRNPFLRRDFRCGEWLGDPVTPLFATWYLPQQDLGFERIQKRIFGGGVRAPFHAVVNGWYYAGLGTVAPDAVVALLRHPVFSVMWSIAFARTGKEVTLGERWMGRRGVDAHRDVIRPAYMEAIALAEASVDHATPSELVALIDGVAIASGAVMFSIVEGAGFAWKAEAALVRFCRRRIRSEPPVGYQALVAGLVAPGPPEPHSVSSLDWSEPTAGERLSGSVALDPARHALLVEQRASLGVWCRARLSGRDETRFNHFLEVAQRFVPVREQIVGDLTLGWPVLRRALRRLGAQLVEGEAIGAVDDIFWLTRSDVDAELNGDHADRSSDVADRRATWEVQRRLVPPDWIGKPSASYSRRRAYAVPSDARGALVAGVPASPGRATGPVRIVSSLDQFDAVQPGDVLVARLTAPAWTPLFGRVAAVVTDSGSLAAHASLIAREYGLPAVVGCRNATLVLRDGDIVTVDGTAGTVR